MAVYLTMAAVLLISGILLDKSHWKHSRKLYCGLAWLALFGVSGLRHSVGYDYNLYANTYLNFIKWDMETIAAYRNEKGFVIPLKYFSALVQDYRPFLIIIAFIISTGVVLYIYLYSEKPYISVSAFLFFGLFFNSMNFMRQMIAAVIVAFAIKYVKEKCFIRFLIIVLFASTIHISALVMIPVYFMMKIKMNTVYLSVLTAASVLCYIFAEDILEFVTEFYYEGRFFGDSGLNPIYTIFFAVLFVLCFAVRKKLIEQNPMNNALLVMLYMTVLAEFIGTKWGIVSRFALIFFIPPVLLLAPQVVMIYNQLLQDKLKDKSKALVGKCILNSAFIVAGLSMYVYFMSVNYNGVLPYKTLFDSNNASTVEEV